jgi:hypothetical protein
MNDATVPEDPRVVRQRVLATYLWVSLGVALLLAVLTAVAPDALTDDVGPWMVGALILAPVGRLLWLLVRWTKRGDRRYAIAILVLLAVMATALLVAH